MIVFMIEVHNEGHDNCMAHAPSAIEIIIHQFSSARVALKMLSLSQSPTRMRMDSEKKKKETQ